MSVAECVKVVVRTRPLNQRELTMGCDLVVDIDQSRAQCAVANPNDPGGQPKLFTFDGAYDSYASTETIYYDIVYPLVECVLEGYNGTVFAYGQTGAGKSFTMQGPDKVTVHKGIIPRTFEHIFEATATTENVKFLIYASYLEIYNEDVHDLLGDDVKRKLKIKEHPERGVYVAGLSMHAVHNVSECDVLMQRGFKNRATGATLMNTDSSRSHSIFTVHLEMMENSAEGEHIRTAKLHLVDLAGSERQSKTGSTGDRLKEATKINLSLSALGNVISSLVNEKATHIPYRDSKLTRLLQDSLGGNTKTIMIACISPADNNYDETLSTLRYANRAKNIKNKPVINEDPKDALLRQYQDEIRKLKELLSISQMPMAESAWTNNISESVEAKLREQFDKQMELLKQRYKEEQVNKEKLQMQYDKLKQEYDTALNERVDPKEKLKELEQIQKQMVGGEEIGNKELVEKRKRKRKEAEKRSKKIIEVQNKEAMELLIHNRFAGQDQLENTRRTLEEERQKNEGLRKELQDLQNEFEQDRTEYLDTMRIQERQLKLLQSILDRVQPCLKRENNYSDIEAIKNNAKWDENSQNWILPEMVVTRTHLPRTKTSISLAETSTEKNNIERSGMDSDSEDELLRIRLRKSEEENIVGNYFKPLRPSSILLRTAADKNRELKTPSYFPNSRKTWEHILSGVVFTNDIYEDADASGSPVAQPRPVRLSALHPGSAQN